LRRVGIKQLIDVRLNNSSQLAGFTKKDDLIFFLREICDANYLHEPLLAPTSEILTSYKKKKITWDDYEKLFFELMTVRKVEEKINRNILDQPTVLLCSESTAAQCHRRLVLEYLQSRWGNFEIIHL
jgi:uncharacterized protein (DUF488 family)